MAKPVDLENDECVGVETMNGLMGELAMIRLCALLLAMFAASAALAADADHGKQLAAMRCVPCHGVPSQPNDVAKATPFEVMARKFAPTPEVLTFRILDPHPRMNLALTRREAEDIAAYINELAK